MSANGMDLRKKSNFFRSQHRFVASSLGPIMLYMMLFTLLPMIWAVVITFFNYSPTRTGGSILGLGGNNPFIGLSNYAELFSDTRNGQQFRISLFNTIIFALLVLPLNLIITLPTAMLIESVRERMKVAFRMIYFLPTVTSLVAVSLIWKNIIYHPTYGLLNVALKGGGLPGYAWLTDSKTTFLGVSLPMLACIIAYLWSDFGYNVVIFMAGLQSIPDVFREAAIVDGANIWQRFRHITLPLLRSTITFVIVVTMLSSWQVFVIFYVMTSGGPNDLTRTLVLHIYETAFRSQSMGLASAVAMALFVLILVTTLVQMRLLRKDWEY